MGSPGSAYSGARTYGTIFSAGARAQPACASALAVSSLRNWRRDNSASAAWVIRAASTIISAMAGRTVGQVRTILDVTVTAQAPLHLQRVRARDQRHPLD